MKEKIFSALKTACGNTTSISDKTLEKMAEILAVTVTEESQIEAAIEIQKPMLQEFNGNINHVAAEAAKKVKPEKTEKPPKVEKTEKAEKTDDDSEMPSWAKKLLADNTELKTKFEAQEKEKTSAALTDKVVKHEKLKGIPASWLKGRNLIVNSEAEIDQLVAGIETDYNGFKQEMAEQGVVISVPPSGQGSVKEGEAQGKALAEKRNTNSSDGVKGKKV